MPSDSSHKFMVALLVENRDPAGVAGPFRPENEISSSAREKPSRQFRCSLWGERDHIGYTRFDAVVRSQLRRSGSRLRRRMALAQLIRHLPLLARQLNARRKPAALASSSEQNQRSAWVPA